MTRDAIQAQLPNGVIPGKYLPILITTSRGTNNDNTVLEATERKMSFRIGGESFCLLKVSTFYYSNRENRENADNFSYQMAESGN